MPTFDSTNPHRYEYEPTTDVCCCKLDFLGHPGYCVGDDGSVWTCRTKKTGKGAGKGSIAIGRIWRRMTPDKLAKWGHQRVTLLSRQRLSVHGLVLTAFVGPCPNGMECRHYPDGNPANNHVENLRWGTPTENQRDRILHGTSAMGERNTQAIMTEAVVREIKIRHKNGECPADIARDVGYRYHTVRAVTKGINWKHITV